MIQKIKTALLSLATLTLIATPALAIAPAAHAQFTTQNLVQGACSGSNGDLTGGSGCPATSTGGLQALLNKVINIFSIVVGLIAVIMIIVGGLRYITSGGDSGKVGTAKTTIIYALIGLVVVALAQLIVHFVLNQTSGIAG